MARDATKFAALVVAQLGGDATAAVGFLQAARAAAEATLGGHSAAGAAAQPVGPVSKTNGKTPVDCELLRLPAVSFAAPRGRFDVVFRTTGMALQPKSGLLHGPIPWDHITAVVQVPKPESYRKAAWS